MGKPLSYKEIIKSKKPQAAIKQVAANPLTPHMTQAQMDLIKLKEKEFVKFCNTLRCPLCSAQLDGGVSATSANLFCRANPEEYTANYFRNDSIPYKRVVRITFDPIQYRIITYHDSPDSKFKNIISKVDLSIPRQDIRERDAVKMFEFDGPSLPVKKESDERIFLDKIKTFIIFS